MEIIKQLFDIASLFDKIDNLNTARDTFLKIAPIELEYRGMDKDNIQVILDDIYSTLHIPEHVRSAGDVEIVHL